MNSSRSRSFQCFLIASGAFCYVDCGVLGFQCFLIASSVWEGEGVYIGGVLLMTDPPSHTYKSYINSTRERRDLTSFGKERAEVNT